MKFPNDYLSNKEGDRTKWLTDEYIELVKDKFKIDVDRSLVTIHSCQCSGIECYRCHANSRMAGSGFDGSCPMCGQPLMKVTNNNICDCGTLTHLCSYDRSVMVTAVGTIPMFMLPAAGVEDII